MSKLADQIVSLEKQRTAALDRLNALHTKSVEEDRTFDDSEQAAFDDVQKTVNSLGEQIKRTRELELLNAKSAQPVIESNRGVEATYPTVGRVVSNVAKGTAFTRFVAAMAQAKGSRSEALEIAKRWESSTPEVTAVLKAAVAAGTTTDTTWAAPLAPYRDMEAEFIDLLRPETIVGQMNGFRRVPFDVRMARQLTGATAQWVGEGNPKPVSAMSFDTVTVPHTKLATIVVMTDELMKLSSPGAEALVRQDMVDTVAAFIDQQMLDPNVTASAGVNPGSLTNGAPTIASTGTTVAAITSDLTTAMNSMASANIRMRSPYWVMPTRTRNYLMTLRTTQDIFAFRDDLARGVLFGIPVIVSNNIALYDADGAGTGTALATTITLIEASEILLADDGQVMIDISKEASLQMNSTPSQGPTTLVSMWQNNLTAIRAERYIYWARRRAQAVFTITGVLY